MKKNSPPIWTHNVGNSSSDIKRWNLKNTEARILIAAIETLQTALFFLHCKSYYNAVANQKQLTYIFIILTIT